MIENNKWCSSLKNAPNNVFIDSNDSRGFVVYEKTIDRIFMNNISLTSYSPEKMENGAP